MPLNPHHHVQDQRDKQKRHKGPERLQKDRARAAAYQARHQPEKAATEQIKTAAVPAVVKLPFTGTILPINASKESLVPTTPPASSSN